MFVGQLRTIIFSLKCSALTSYNLDVTVLNNTDVIHHIQFIEFQIILYHFNFSNKFSITKLESFFCLLEKLTMWSYVIGFTSTY